jgi:transposase
MPLKKYTDEFKKQIVLLMQNGKRRIDITREYGIDKSTLSTWYKEYTTTGSFGRKSNLSESEKELRAIKKEVLQLRMENDLLKQVALILGRRDK